ncbi:MAG: DUF5722 domain-containing protein, partial [Solirubrobacteraceae bacterium]
VSASAETIAVRGETAAGEVALHELAPYEDAGARGEPLASARPGADGSYAFEVPRFAAGRDRVFSKFLVTEEDGEPAGPARWVTDLPAERDFAFPQPPTKKGLQVQMTDDAEELGIGHAGINLALDQYLYETEVPGDTITFESGGREFHFSAGAVHALDRRIESLSDNGVLVDLILILYDNPRPNSPNDVLIHPDAARGEGTVYAFNTATAEGVAYFTAAMEFFTRRYTRPDERFGRAVGFIVGNEVDAQWVWQNMGEKTVEAFMEEYARTVRLTWLAARKAYAHARVYISLTHFWNRAFADQPLRYYPGRRVVAEMDAIADRGGDFPWHLAHHPYPEDLFDPAYWNDTSAIDSFDSPRITFKNLDVLTRYFGRPELAFDGERRRIILSEQGFHTPSYSARDQDLQAAAYALAYYKVRFLDGIDAFILHRHVDHKLEGGLRLGLWTWDDERPEPSSPGARKRAYEVFQAIDTARSLEVTEFAKAIVGIDDWAEKVPGFDPHALADRDAPTLVGTRFVRDALDARAVAPFERWEPADNARTADPEDGSLLVAFDALGKLWRGADVRPAAPIDARGRPHLSVALALPDADPQQPYEAKVKVYDGRSVAEGVAALEPADGINRSALDLRGWPGLDSVDRVKVWVRRVGNEDWRGSLRLEDVAFAERVVPAAGHANLRLEASAMRLHPGEELSIAVTNLDAQTLRGEIELEPSESLRVAPAVLDVGGLATGESRRFAVRIEAVTGTEPRLRATYRATTFERAVRLLADPTGEADLPPGVRVLYNFEGSTQGWRAGANVASVSSEPTFLNAPRRPRLGEYVLAAAGEDVPADAWRTVAVEPPGGIDLSGAAPFFVHVNGYGGVPGATYEARVELTSAAGDVLTRTVPVSADAWNRVEVATAGWPGAADVVRIAVSYRAAGSDMIWRSQFQVDFVGYETGG